MGAAAAGAAVGGGLLNAYSQIQAGKQAVVTANRQQTYLNDQARDVIAAGDYQSAMIGEQGQQLAASQRTGFAANGVAVGSGSAQRVQDSTVSASAQDAAQVRLNAFNQAMGLVTQGNEIVTEAKSQAKNSKFSAFSSLLTGGGQAYSMYKRG